MIPWKDNSRRYQNHIQKKSKAIIKGKSPREKKPKYLNQFELHTLLSDLELKSEVDWEWFILLVARTGMRFSEALALTPKDFDFAHQSLSISKT
jgi:integrase